MDEDNIEDVQFIQNVDGCNSTSFKKGAGQPKQIELTLYTYYNPDVTVSESVGTVYVSTQHKDHIIPRQE